MTPETADEIANWCGGSKVVEQDAEEPPNEFVGVNVPSPSGVIRASETDFVFASPNGGFYVLDQDRFNERFVAL